MTPTQIKKMLEDDKGTMVIDAGGRINRQFLNRVCSSYPNIISQLLKENEEMRECLEDILNADPSCEKAQNLLTKLKGGE